jgi:hypothetical protein
MSDLATKLEQAAEILLHNPCEVYDLRNTCRDAAKSLAAKDARIAELEATELARQLASCRRMLDQITDKGVLAALRDANARVEQAEAQLAEAKERIACYWNPTAVAWQLEAEKMRNELAEAKSSLSAMEGERDQLKWAILNAGDVSFVGVPELSARIASLEKSVAMLREVLAFAEGSVAASAYRELHEPPFKHGRAQEALEKVRAALQIEAGQERAETGDPAA